MSELYTQPTHDNDNELPDTWQLTDERSVSLARHGAQALMRLHGLGQDLIDSASLVLTELAANEVEHEENDPRKIRLLVELGGVAREACVRIEASAPDKASVRMLRRMYGKAEDIIGDDESEDGRGRLLTEALADKVDIFWDKERNLRVIAARICPKPADGDHNHDLAA